MANVSLPQETVHSMGANIRQVLRMTKRYVASYYYSRTERHLFQDVQTYCMFVGHARSGHSMIGALLDAHPQIVVADEVDTLEYIAAGFSREQIWHIVLARAEKQARKGRTKGGRDGKVYSYHVPDQWQGRFHKLQVIGTSKAGISTQRLALQPALLQRLNNTMLDAKVKFVHVIRNPYDTISTMNLRAGRPLANGIERYFANCETLATIRQAVQSTDMFSMKQEDFIADPVTHLQHLCRFLGVEAHEQYIDACTRILYTSPSKSRQHVQWSPDLIDAVRQQSARFDFLDGYTYQD